MFKEYTDVIFKGDYEHPIHITFKDAYIVLTGEGGNRHIIVGDKDGYMDIWVDTHTYGKYFAFLGNTCMITRNPSGTLVNRVWCLINKTTEKYNCLNHWTEDNLNKFFESIYVSAKKGFYF